MINYYPGYKIRVLCILLSLSLFSPPASLGWLVVFLHLANVFFFCGNNTRFSCRRSGTWTPTLLPQLLRSHSFKSQRPFNLLPRHLGPQVFRPGSILLRPTTSLQQRLFCDDRPG